jgi:DNA polymerase
VLYLDLEVYSEVSITDVPLDVYANHPSTYINLACCAFDDSRVLAFSDTYRDPDTASLGEFREVLRTTQAPLCAWNVGFERTVLAAKGFPTPISRWTDAMVHARYVGLPGGLKQCCKVPLLGVPSHAATKSETLLIKKFCMPLGPKAKPGTPEEWAAFVEYCRRDVESLRYIHDHLTRRYPFPDSERRVWELDQHINERGLPIDVDTARHAAGEVVRLTDEAQGKLRKLTGLDNPNSVQQLSPWLKERGYKFDSLGKEFVQSALN